MKKLILVSLIAALGVAPAVVLAQTAGGGTSGSGSTDSGMKGGSGSTQSDQAGSGGSNSGVNAPSASPSTAPQSDTDKSSASDKPTNQADCERAGGKWKTALQRCDLDD